MGSALDFLLPWDRQPLHDSDLLLDQESALARGMVGAWVPTPAGWIDASPTKNHCLTRVGTTSSLVGVGPNNGFAGQFTTADAFTGGDFTPQTPAGLSIAVWVKFATTPTNYAAIFARAGTTGATDAGGDWQVLHRASERRLVYARSGEEIFSFPTTVAADTWHLFHLCVPSSGTTTWWGSGGVYSPGSVLATSATNRIRSAAGVIGINGSVGGQTRGNSGIGRVYLWNRVTTAADAAELYLREWEAYAPQKIWVPVSVGADGGTASITPADGIATTSTFAGTSTAVAALTAAAGAATASTITASAIAAASMTAATGAATTSTLTGDALSAGSAAIVAADGVATAATLGGGSVAVATIGVVAGVATTAIVSGSDITPVVQDINSVGRRRKKVKPLRWQDYDVPIPSDLVKSAIPSDKVIEPIAQPTSVSAGASKLAAKKSALHAPTRTSKPANKVETPQPASQPAQGAEPQFAVAAPIAQPTPAAALPEPTATAPKVLPMMLSDILSAETMTPEEMTAAIKLLARIQLGPQLMRTVPRARLIRVPG